MTNSPYADSKELKDLIHVAGAIEFTDGVLENTQLPEYRSPLEIATQNLQKVLEMRYDNMTYDGLQAVIKRLKCNFKIFAYNGNYSSKNSVTCVVNEWDLFELCDKVIAQNCYGCKNKNRRGCKIRKALHGVGCPAANPNACNGVCEYKTEEVEGLV